MHPTTIAHRPAEPGTELPSLTLPAGQGCQGEALAENLVGEVRQDLSDEVREFWIRWFGRRIAMHMDSYAATGDFGERGSADAARLRMEALIRGRSAAQVARMQHLQAERMALEPGAALA